MQILLACAKTMNESTPVRVSGATTPLFNTAAELFAEELSMMDIEDLADVLHCNRKIAAENKLRYMQFRDDGQKLPAILAYYGQAYKCLQADSLTAPDFDYAQSHLHITSFLYGLLRPLDRIHPYRLEGKSILQSAHADSMFSYWQELLTDVLLKSVEADDGLLLHLATKEMERLFDWKRVKKGLRIIQPQFLVNTGGKLKAVSVYAKSCRGAMTRYVIENRISTPESLEAFSYQGFRYAPEHSSDDTPVFIMDL